MSVSRYCKIMSSLCEIIYRWRKYASILCNVQIMLPNVATISNSVARWRAMHVSRLQNVRCIHWTQNCWFYEVCLVQLTKVKLSVSFKDGHKFNTIMYKVLKLRPSFKHFNYTRQMASHAVHPPLPVHSISWTVSAWLASLKDGRTTWHPAANAGAKFRIGRTLVDLADVTIDDVT